MTKLTEQEQAEILEDYLSGLEKGDAFNIPKDVDDAEIVALMKFGKELRVSQTISTPSEALLNGYTKQRRYNILKLLIPLPIVGVALSAILFVTMKQPATTVRLSAGDIQNVETELAQIEQLNADLEVVLADLDTTITEVDEILADDSFTDIEAAVLEAQL